MGQQATPDARVGEDDDSPWYEVDGDEDEDVISETDVAQVLPPFVAEGQRHPVRQGVVLEGTDEEEG